MISVVTNLIDNAVKASRKESKIVLEATPDHLMVQDFGKGIPKEDLEMVTEPFYMVDKSRSRAKGSVGPVSYSHLDVYKRKVFLKQ